MIMIIGVEQEPRVQFSIDAEADSMPDLIKLHDGSLIMKVGAYGSGHGHLKWCYRRIGEIRELTSFCHVDPWPSLTALRGTHHK